MSWENFPLEIEDDLDKARFNEIISAINERGGGPMTLLDGEEDIDVNLINSLRSEIEDLIPQFWDSSRNIAYTQENLFTDQAIGDNSDWTRVPDRFGDESFGSVQHGDDICIEWFNEMYQVLNALIFRKVDVSSVSIDSYTTARIAAGGGFLAGASWDGVTYLEQNNTSDVSAGLDQDFIDEQWQSALYTMSGIGFYKYFRAWIHNYEKNTLGQSMTDSQVFMVLASEPTSVFMSGHVIIENEIVSFSYNGEMTYNQKLIGGLDPDTRFWWGTVLGRGQYNTTPSAHSVGCEVGNSYSGSAIKHPLAEGYIKDWFGGIRSQGKVSLLFDDLPILSEAPLELKLVASIKKNNTTDIADQVTIGSTTVNDADISTDYTSHIFTLNPSLYPIGSSVLTITGSGTEGTYPDDPDFLTPPPSNNYVNGTSNKSRIYSIESTAGKTCLIFKPNYVFI